MTPPNEQKKAVDELLTEDSPEGYSETLDTLFEAWLCSNYPNNLTGEQRASLYYDYKAMKRFMGKLKQSGVSAAILALLLFCDSLQLVEDLF